jgi:hypothetical protein
LTRRAKWYYLELMFIGFKPSFLKMGISPMKGNLGREFFSVLKSIERSAL